MVGLATGVGLGVLEVAVGVVVIVGVEDGVGVKSWQMSPFWQAAPLTKMQSPHEPFAGLAQLAGHWQHSEVPGELYS